MDPCDSIIWPFYLAINSILNFDNFTIQGISKLCQKKKISEETLVSSYHGEKVIGKKWNTWRIRTAWTLKMEIWRERKKGKLDVRLLGK